MASIDASSSLASNLSVPIAPASSPSSSLPIRTSCEACRNRKLKCSGPPALPQEGRRGRCERCSKEDVACHFVVRAPVGRPKGAKTVHHKKRKFQLEAEDKANSFSSDTATTANASSVKTTDNPLAALQYAAKRGQPSTEGLLAQQMLDVPSKQQVHASSSQATSSTHPMAAFAPVHPLNQASALAASQPHPLIIPQSRPLQPPPHVDPALLYNGYSDDSSLATLEMAAYLESLDRVEIRPSDGLRADMLRRATASLPLQQQQPASLPPSLMGYGTYPSTSLASTYRSEPTISDRSIFDGTILDEGVSYAVPSDFSWWNVGLDGAFMGAATTVEPPPASQSAFAAAVPSIAGLNTTASQQALGGSNSGPPVSPTYATWPRGPASGMGRGFLETAEGQLMTGGPWPIDEERQGSTIKKSCCASKSAANDGKLAPTSSTAIEAASAHQQSGTGSKSSCCSKPDNQHDAKEVIPSLKAKDDSVKACPRTGAAACCCNETGKQGSPNADVSANNATNEDRGASMDATTSTAMTTTTTATSATSADSPATSAAAVSPRVHCVPNPSGSGCTCLCESDVRLLRVRHTLAATTPSSPSSANAGLEADASPASLHLTLSASQAISASCACSSTCPTCKEKPGSAASNASLLISLSLQIYSRAVRILRDGFAPKASAMKDKSPRKVDVDLSGSEDDKPRPSSAHSTLTVDGSGSSTALASSSEGNRGLEIQIGDYRPRPENAERIALLAMRLELWDLERGMETVYKMATGSGGSDGSSGSSMISRPGTADQAEPASGGTAPALAPIDGVVIHKLRGQLKEMISRVERMERNWERRRRG